MMARTGFRIDVKVIIMLKIWTPLPAIHIMNIVRGNPCAGERASSHALLCLNAASACCRFTAPAPVTSSASRPATALAA
jgi:hypothetical protein